VEIVEVASGVNVVNAIRVVAIVGNDAPQPKPPDAACDAQQSQGVAGCQPRRLQDDARRACRPTRR